MTLLQRFEASSFIALGRYVRKTLLSGFVLCIVAAAGVLHAAPRDDALPDYKPERQVSGTLRSSGNDNMASLLKRWQAGFRKYQPGIVFADALKGTGSGIYGLEMRTSDMALMSRPIHPFERYGTYERSWTYPVEIEVATGAAEALHKSPALALMVHKDNPLSGLTLKQVDRIFGAERGGGWNQLSWDEKVARLPAENIRTWGQLGLKGAWADKPIHVYGPPLLGAGAITFFQARVMGGGAKWNEDFREYEDRKQMIADLARDPYGIAYGPAAYRTAAVRVIPLAEGDGRPVVLSKGTVADRSYPLARPVYIDYTIDNVKSDIADPRVHPKLREFLRYVLSRQGQQDVVRDGNYLPLPAGVVRAQREKLDSKIFPPEKLLLGD
jgi:phosphate transport system substrate-binding protein